MPTSYSDRLLGRNKSAAPPERPQVPLAAETPVPVSAPTQPRGSYSERLLAPPGRKPAEPQPIPQSSSEKAASIGDIAIASLTATSEDRARFYAQQRGLPLDRYRIIHDRVAYQDDDGEWYLERPNAIWDDPATWFQMAAAGTGDTISKGPAIVTGAATAPMLLTGPAGTAASIGLTGLAGAGGQAVREYLAHQLAGQESTPQEIGGRLAQTAATEGLAQGIGAGITTLGQRHLVGDISRLDPRATQELARKANEQGIQLTPGEATNLSSLKARQRLLSNFPHTSDEMADFYRHRAQNQIAPAVERHLDELSSVSSPEIAGQMVRDAAEAVMKDVAKERAAAASPLYDRAFAEAPAVNIDPVLGYINNQLKIAKGGIKDALLKARGYLHDTITDPRTGEQITVPETRLESLHQAKLALDDLLDQGRDTGMGRTAKANLTRVKNDLLKVMDDASGDYKAARAIFADRSPDVIKVREGVLGVIADLPELQLRHAASKLFSAGNVGVKDVSSARMLIRDKSPESWQAIKRAWLEEQWMTAGKETLTSGAPVNRGAKFRKIVFGDLKQSQLVKRMLEPRELTAWRDLAEVLEASGRVKPIGSDTTWNQEMTKLARDEASSWLARTLRYMTVDVAKTISERMTEGNLRKSAGRLAELVTSPTGIQRMREIKQLRAPDAVKRVLLGRVIWESGELAANAGLSALSPDKSGAIPQ